MRRIPRLEPGLSEKNSNEHQIVNHGAAISFNVIVATSDVKGKKMRYRHASMLVLLLLLLLSGCQSGSSPAPIGTFINQSDPSQLLELTLVAAQTPNVFIRISIKTGANKYFGKSVGTYALKTQQESGRGTF